MGAQPAIAELLGIADQCLNAFPGHELHDYVIHVTHTKGQSPIFLLIQWLLILHLVVKECVYNRIPAARRASVQDVLSQPKYSWRTKRGLLVKANVSKGILDELEALSEAGEF